MAGHLRGVLTGERLKDTSRDHSGYSKSRKELIAKVKEFGVTVENGVWADTYCGLQVMLLFLDFKDIRCVMEYSAARVDALQDQGDENAIATVAEELRLIQGTKPDLITETIKMDRDLKLPWVTFDANWENWKLDQ